MNRIVVFIFLLFALTSFTGDGFKLIKTIPVKATFITTDKLGNCYVIDENNQLTKYNALGEREANYSDKYMGKLKSADVSNPLKILLLYADFNQITSLDNKLSLRTQVPLRELNILQPLAVCTSVNDGLWIFDQQDFQLKRLDLNLNIVQESGNLMQITGKEIKPSHLFENNGYVYLNNPEIGIMVFDLFGSYFKTIPLTQVSGIQFIGDELFYYRKGVLTAYNIKTLSERIIELPAGSDSSIYNVRVEEQKVYLLKDQQLNIYSRL